MSTDDDRLSERDRQVHVIGATDDQYLYVGHGDHCVLLCDLDTPKWKNAVGLTPDAARHLAAELRRAATLSERGA